MTILAVVEGILGMVTMVMRKGPAKERWEAKEKNVKFAKVHKILGYLILLFGNITVSTGVGKYVSQKLGL